MQDPINSTLPGSCVLTIRIELRPDWVWHFVKSVTECGERWEDETKHGRGPGWGRAETRAPDAQCEGYQSSARDNGTGTVMGALSLSWRDLTWLLCSNVLTLRSSSLALNKKNLEFIFVVCIFPDLCDINLSVFRSYHRYGHGQSGK